MKKILPIILVLTLVLTGIAYADAPFEMTLSLSGDNPYSTTVIVNSGDQISIQLGETNVLLTVEGKQKEGLNFSLEPKLEYKDETYGIAELGSFLLPENAVETLTEIGKDSPVLTIRWKQLGLDPAYQALVDRVSSLLKGDTTVEGDFSMIFRFLAGNPAADNAGFYVNDLDNDGTPELLFGENYPGSKGTVFYDLYTIKDGELVHVFDGWDRSRYYLCENGGIAHEGSSSAFESFTSLNYYANGVLNLMQSIIYNSNVNPENPWRISLISEFEPSDTDQLVDESEALYTLALYPYQQVNLEPFVK